MATIERIQDFGGGLSNRTIFDADDSQRRIQHRFNNQAHIPTKTNYSSGNYIGQDGLDLGVSRTYDVRQLNSQRGLSPSIQSNNAMTVATGLIPDMKGGTPISMRGLDLSKNYGHSSAKQNLTGMNPRNLGILNYGLYEAPQRQIKQGSESGRILRAEHEAPTSLASRIQRVGGKTR